MNVIICGSRKFEDDAHVFDELDRLLTDLPITKVAHGAAPGVDAMADRWARARGLPVQVFRADWNRHGRSAGPRRNQEMLDCFQPEAVIAFDGGRGTADIVRRARAVAVKVIHA